MTEYLIHILKENFGSNNDKNKNKSNSLEILIVLIHFAIALFAIFLSFKRNNGFNILSFLAALFFPIIYCLYALAVPV
ncbi:MAG: hypothetical protein Ct9H90mP28_0050 [Paracoccaceae bacterium]|nr:MAG: hypothetical protein Ct9H90mP28_0050 [Paracoccaceae bacterium]